MKAEDKKIAVIGIGGVGGYIAAMLAKVYPHVTMPVEPEGKVSGKMDWCFTVIIKEKLLQDRNG